MRKPYYTDGEESEWDSGNPRKAMPDKLTFPKCSDKQKTWEKIRKN